MIPRRAPDYFFLRYGAALQPSAKKIKLFHSDDILCAGSTLHLEVLDALA